MLPMTQCIFRGRIHAKHQNGFDVFNCSHESTTDLCTLADQGLKMLTGHPVSICDNCPHFADSTLPVTLQFEPLDLPPRTSDKVLVTLAIGTKFKQLLDIARPTFQAYTARHGADYVEIVLDSSNYPEGEKFRARQLFDRGYKQVLFVDADAIIMYGSANLFDLPGCHVAIHDDRKFLTSTTWLENEYDRLIESQGWPIEQPLHCYNTGVMLIRDPRVLEMPKPFPRSHTAEQSLINLNIARFKLAVYELDRTWNEQWWFDGKLPERQGTRIYHWASAPFAARVAEMTARRDGTEIVTESPSWPLGDQVERALTFVGITKERVSQWVGAPCNCAARQQKLNQLGDWAAKALGGLWTPAQAVAELPAK